MIFCYQARKEDYRAQEAGKTNQAAGRIRITPEITGESIRLCFGVLHWGDHNFSCGVREFGSAESFETAIPEVIETFAKGNFPETLQLLENHFGP